MEQLAVTFAQSDQSWDDFLKGIEITKTIKTALSAIDPGALVEGFAGIETHEIRVGSVLLNARTYSEMRKWGKDLLDPETDAGTIKKGIMAMIWGAEITVSQKVPDNIIIVLSDPEMKKIASLINLSETLPQSDQLLKLHDQCNQLTSDLAACQQNINNMKKSLKELLRTSE